MAFSSQPPSKLDETKDRLLSVVATDEKPAATRRIGIDVDADLYRSLRVHAASEGRTLADITRELWRGLVGK